MCRGPRDGESDGVNSQRDPSAKKSPPKQPTPAREQPDDAEPSPGKEATLDPESPGATIDCVDQNGMAVESGSFFPVGTWTITCKATDACGNMKTCVFVIIVYC